MLLTKKLQKDDIAAIKLSSGEEVVGAVVAITDTTIEISKPLIIGMQQQQNPNTGQVEVGIGFGPFMLSLPDDGIVKFGTDKVMLCIPARTEVDDSYRKSVSPVELPPTKSLIV